jgi:undecaprenyl-phosphate 4-deoxy-4-formamido-L-arabinose transferase
MPFLPISIVIPVYRGETTLEGLLREIEPLTLASNTPDGESFRVTEVLLVHDGAIDRSAEIILALADRLPFVRPVWLSRNYGQHAATLAGIAASTGAYVVTMDEDGQHDPRDIGLLIDRARREGAALAYGVPKNGTPHSWFRNLASAGTKIFFAWALDSEGIGRFSSFRLLWGEVGRGLAAHCGHGVYLDVALSWVIGRSARCPVVFREESGRPSGYGFWRLVDHFWRLVLTSGNRPLRFISILGVLSMFAGIGLFGYALYQKVMSRVPVQGWTSTFMTVAFFSGCVMFSLGVVAEYLGLVLKLVMGRPAYLVVSRQPGRRPPP